MNDNLQPSQVSVSERLREPDPERSDTPGHQAVGARQHAEPPQPEGFSPVSALETAGGGLATGDVLTESEVAAIVAAKRALRAVETRLVHEYVNDPAMTTSRAMDYGRLREAGDMAGEALFNVLNTASSYADCPVSKRAIDAADWQKPELAAVGGGE